MIRRPGSSSLMAVTASALALLSQSAAGAGDVARGQALFAVCSTCHGQNAEGMQEMNGPALAGREVWYLVRQLENFKTGVRGAHPDDVYGRQMAPMAQLLADAQAIQDVAAYLNSLGH